MHTKIRAMDKMLINNNNFKFFFQEYFEPVFQFARKYTENDAIARDFTQDAFIKLYERRKDFEVIEKAKSFLYTTTRNLCLNHLKHKKIEHQYFQEVKIEGRGSRRAILPGRGDLPGDPPHFTGRDRSTSSSNPGSHSCQPRW